MKHTTIKSPNLIIFEVMLYLPYSFDSALDKPSNPDFEDEYAPAPIAELVEETCMILPHLSLIILVINI